MTVAALLFLLAGAAIVGWQRRAAACPDHSRAAGAFAWLLGAMSFLAGAVLLRL